MSDVFTTSRLVYIDTWNDNTYSDEIIIWSKITSTVLKTIQCCCISKTTHYLTVIASLWYYQLKYVLLVYRLCLSKIVSLKLCFLYCSSETFFKTYFNRTRFNEYIGVIVRIHSISCQQWGTFVKYVSLKIVSKSIYFYIYV